MGERVLQRPLLKQFLRKMTERRSSIEMSFHGTDDFYVEAITDKGLRTDTCLTGNYGDGAYVGVHAGLAHQYANPDRDGQRSVMKSPRPIENGIPLSIVLWMTTACW